MTCYEPPTRGSMPSTCTYTQTIPLELVSTTTYYPTFIYPFLSSPPDSRFSRQLHRQHTSSFQPLPCSLILSKSLSFTPSVGRVRGKQGQEAGRRALALWIFFELPVRSRPLLRTAGVATSTLRRTFVDRAACTREII